MNNNTNRKTGISDKEVLDSRNKYGNNKIDIKKRNTFFRLVIESLNDPIIKILLIALGIKTLFLFKDSNVYETLGIAVAVFIASLIPVSPSAQMIMISLTPRFFKLFRTESQYFELSFSPI